MPDLGELETTDDGPICHYCGDPIGGGAEAVAAKDGSVIEYSSHKRPVFSERGFLAVLHRQCFQEVVQAARTDS